MFCLIPKLADSFKQEIIDGKIDPMKLAEMTSEERRAFFNEKLGGEMNAKEVNALFESKLLLKNKQLGYINWAKQMLGEKTPAGRDIISKIEKMDNILDPGVEDAFLKDLAAKKLGTEITFDEAKNMTELSAKMKEAENKLTPETKDGSKEALEYGAYKWALEKYVDKLKVSNSNKTVGQIIKENINPLTLAQNIGGFAKGIWSAFDHSALGRQGIKVLIDSPTIWAKNALDSFGMIMKQVVNGKESDAVMDGIMADIYSRQNARNGNFRRMKIDIGEFEEAHPSALPEKLPIIGNLYKASEVAYTGFLRMARADLADKMIKIAEKNGENIKDVKTAQGIGQFVNSMTGRGHLGKAEGFAKGINNIFFSAKKVVSDFDFLTGFQARDIPRSMKVRAAYNLIKVAGGVTAMATLFNSLNPGTVETDPTSTNFLKVKIGDTYHDVLGGMPGIVVLVSRIKMNKKKTSTGKISALNTGKYGTETSMDLFWQWIQNKLSPLGSLMKDFANRVDYDGNPVTVEGEALKTITPLPISDISSISGSKNPAELKALSNFLNFIGIQRSVTPAPKKKKSPLFK